MANPGTQADFQILAAQLSSFQASLLSAQTALNNVVITGTQVYNSPGLPEFFPTTYVAYKTALSQANTAINTFLSTFPVIPSL